MYKDVKRYLYTNRAYPQVEFGDRDHVVQYIKQYLSDYPTGITYAFGDIEMFRRIPYPYSKYGVTHTGIVFNWNYITQTVHTYNKETEYGDVVYCGITTDYNTREVIERGRLVLLAFYPFLAADENSTIFRLDGNMGNDHIWNLEWKIEDDDIYGIQ